VFDEIRGKQGDLVWRGRKHKEENMSNNYYSQTRTPFGQLPLFTIRNLTDYYVPSYTICQRVAPDYFKFLPLTEISFSSSLIL